jgi:hypothetical protein
MNFPVLDLAPLQRLSCRSFAANAVRLQNFMRSPTISATSSKMMAAYLLISTIRRGAQAIAAEFFRRTIVCKHVCLEGKNEWPASRKKAIRFDASYMFVTAQFMNRSRIPLILVLIGVPIAPALAQSFPGESLTVDLNQVNGQPNGSFILGGTIPTLSFHVIAGKPFATGHVYYTVSDESGRVIAGPDIPIPFTDDASGNANPPAVNAPASKLGYYQVDAHMGDGTTLYPVGNTLGTRPPGFITYAVMHDPDSRYKYSSSLSRFGVQDQSLSQKGIARGMVA